MSAEHDADEIASLRRSLRRLQLGVLAVAATGAALAVVGWSSSPTVLRANRLDIVDDRGKLRARISAEALETRMLLVGAPASNGKGQTPTVEIRLGVDYESIELNDETGSLNLDSGKLVMRDPSREERIKLLRRIPEMFTERSRPAYLQITNRNMFPQITLPTRADHPDNARK